jgi:hypothetical protein
VKVVQTFVFGGMCAYSEQFLFRGKVCFIKKILSYKTDYKLL